MTDVVLYTCGRWLELRATIASFDLMVSGAGRRWLIDDSGDPDFAARLRTVYGARWDVVSHPTNLGFGGSRAAAWSQLSDPTGHVFQLEDDFAFLEPVDLADLSALLDAQPHLAQVALKRQAWNDHEKAAGGIVEQNPDWYRLGDDGTRQWTEHGVVFTTNPSLYRGQFHHLGWPDVDHSEGIFTHQLLAAGWRFAFWGPPTSAPKVWHIGYQRVGVGH